MSRLKLWLCLCICLKNMIWIHGNRQISRETTTQNLRLQKDNDDGAKNEEDAEYGYYYYYYYGYYPEDDKNADSNDNNNDDRNGRNNGDDDADAVTPTLEPTPYPTVYPTEYPTGPTRRPTRMPTGPTSSPSVAPTTGSPTPVPTRYTTPRPTPGKPTVRPSTNAPSLQPTYGTDHHMKQFSYVADRVVVSMLSASILIWIGLVCLQCYRYFDLSNRISLDDLNVIQKIKDKFISNKSLESEKKRKKRTLKKQPHEDYWNEESEDQTRNFPLRNLARTSFNNSDVDASTNSVNSNTSMLYSVNLDDDNWDERTGAGGGMGVGVGGAVGFGGFGVGGTNIINRNL